MCIHPPKKIGAPGSWEIPKIAQGLGTGPGFKKRVTEGMRYEWWLVLEWRTLAWKDFLAKWDLWWPTQENSVNPRTKQKRLVFLPYLPETWKDQMYHCVQDDNWDFPEVINYLSHELDLLTPDFERVDAWKRELPLGRRYSDFTTWYLRWVRKGKFCDLPSQQWIVQCKHSFLNIFGRSY